MGEIRNECGYDLLQAMNTGHGGTLSTIHAKSAWDALNRLSNLALSATAKPQPRIHAVGDRSRPSTLCCIASATIRAGAASVS